ncbi:FadR/GntR family transcriptional regulator [Chakrabartyella piscis]|uniref:FadR/GntR family transcriptional regulator n=1 Tax=Chakrabartyella piscis TaxID=2918914 RepID=UPI002958D9D8|nr:FCD domain-containing protein [Chakrabartyella piscis]
MPYNNNAKEVAFDFILDKIKAGEWQQGEKIWTEDVLVQNIGVSRIALRNAVERLSGMGVLRKVQGSGTFVERVSDIPLGMSILSLTEDEVMQILEFRKALEPATVELFIYNYTEEHMALLEQSYADMKANVGDVEQFYKADFAFHRTLAKGSNNFFVEKVNDLLVDILENHQKSLYNTIGPDVGIAYHGLLLKYIREKDVEVASLFMKRHIEAAIGDFEKNRGRNKDEVGGVIAT